MFLIFNKNFYMIYKLYKPYNFIKCLFSYLLGIRRGIVFIFLKYLKNY